jgi:hypothetical protein
MAVVDGKVVAVDGVVDPVVEPELLVVVEVGLVDVNVVGVDVGSQASKSIAKTMMLNKENNRWRNDFISSSTGR